MDCSPLGSLYCHSLHPRLLPSAPNPRPKSRGNIRPGDRCKQPGSWSSSLAGPGARIATRLLSVPQTYLVGAELPHARKGTPRHSRRRPQAEALPRWSKYKSSDRPSHSSKLLIVASSKQKIDQMAQNFERKQIGNRIPTWSINGSA